MLNTWLFGGWAPDADAVVPSAANRLIASTTIDSLFRIELNPLSVIPRWTAPILLDEDRAQPVRAEIP
jgi:hypothetical protein